MLICTDGIYRAIPETALHAILLSDHTPAEKQQLLLNAAAHGGSDDDKSLVLIRCENQSSSGSGNAASRTS